MIDYLIRAESRTVWQTYAQSEGWIDEDNNPTPGTLIDEIGFVVLTPAVVDENFQITTPAVLDDWHHVNLRLIDPPEQMSVKFAQGKSVEVRGVGAIEVGLEPTRVQILSAADIDTPIRVWADGMNFEELPVITTTKKRKGKA